MPSEQSQHKAGRAEDRQVAGIIERASGGNAFVRALSVGIARRPSDPMVPRAMMQQYRLRAGVFVEGTTQRGPGRQGSKKLVDEIEKINGLTPDAWARVIEFDQGTVIAPKEQIRLETDGESVSMRVIDLLCPLGMGQRALIVAASRTGKTVLLKQMAQAIGKNYPEMRVVMLLVDERPEEITDMRRSVDGEVFGSSNDREAKSHLRIAQLTIEYVKRRVEAGENVALFLDSLTRLGRAFNRTQRSTGRTMSGGVDIKALEVPRRIFGAARNIEGGGSLTIVASILVDTGSRMDELIFQEFKGTGNMEIVLDRKLVEERIFPAINIAKSGTRREELLWQDSTETLQMLRGYLAKIPPNLAMRKLIDIIQKTSGNDALIRAIAEGAI